MTDLKTTKLRTLKKDYEQICNEYRRRLCEQWELDFDETWWIADKYDELAFSDWVMLISEIRYCVENGVTYEQFSEYWTFIENEAHDGRDRPRINFNSWFMGLRPEMLKDEKESLPTDTEEAD